jgi:hypothetical protein
MYYVVAALFVINCFVLMFVILLQQGKGGDIASAFGESGGVRRAQRRDRAVPGDHRLRGAVRRRRHRAWDSRAAGSGLGCWWALATAARVSTRCTSANCPGTGTDAGEVDSSCPA